jgi:hypothetical protein
MTASLRLFDGRGRWHRWDAKSTTTDYLRLDAHQIGRMGLDCYHRFTWRWSWSTWVGGEHTATITITVEPPLAVTLDYRKGGKPMQQTVTLRRTPTHNGGHRLDWRCPRCGRPVRYLYGAPFVCRHCHDLAYPSQQASHQQAGSFAVKRRLAAIRRKLKMKPDAESLPTRGRPACAGAPGCGCRMNTGSCVTSKRSTCCASSTAGLGRQMWAKHRAEP